MGAIKKITPSFARKYFRSKLDASFLYSRNNKPLVYAQNHWFEINEEPSTSTLYQNRIYEQETTTFFRNYLKKGDTVYDIGANIGYFSLEFARLVGRNGKVLAFEPHPEIFKTLDRNISRNGYKNITGYNYACGNQIGKVDLYLSTENEGNHKIVKNVNSSESVSVKVIELNTFINDDMPRIMKIDIEGAELLALQGIGDSLMKDGSIDFVIEFHPYEMSFFELTGTCLLSSLSKFGYKFRDLAIDDYPVISVDQILSKYKKETYGITNLFCSKIV